jgi:L-amino acid N-acyltransferase YncA
MEQTTRPAESRDVVAIAALEEEARGGLATVQRGGAAWLADHPALGAVGWRVRLADPGWATLVAEVESVVVGVLTMRLPGGYRRDVAVIDLLYVTPGAREVGLGEALLEAAVAGARGAGAREIEASALPGDRESKNLFERAGLVTRLLVVARPLDR